jgi:hypothetical protein
MVSISGRQHTQAIQTESLTSSMKINFWKCEKSCLKSEHKFIDRHLNIRQDSSSTMNSLLPLWWLKAFSRSLVNHHVKEWALTFHRKLDRDIMKDSSDATTIIARDRQSEDITTDHHRETAWWNHEEVVEVEETTAVDETSIVQVHREDSTEIIREMIRTDHRDATKDRLEIIETDHPVTEDRWDKAQEVVLICVRKRKRIRKQFIHIRRGKFSNENCGKDFFWCH